MGCQVGLSALLVIMAIMLVAGIGISIRKFSVLRSAARLNRIQPTEPPAAEKSIEQRLAELEELHERGMIGDAELAAGRAKIIAGN